MKLSKDQDIALKNLKEWYKSTGKRNYVTLGGYAGTGKTTLISVFRQELNKTNKDIKIAFVSYTGKATRVLNNKLKAINAIYPKDSVTTIHSLIYSPIVNESEIITGWELKKEVECDLIIVDESSMINEKIFHDLLQFNKPILAVGDHGQLPPIEGTFNLMHKPDFLLEEIHRQAKDNPIIKLSIQARRMGTVLKGEYSNTIKKVDQNDFEYDGIIERYVRNYTKDTLILSLYNTTRVKINKFIRNNLELDNEMPMINDRVICLRNNHTKKIFNGMLGNIKEIEKKDDKWLSVKINMDDEDNLYTGLAYLPQFNKETPINFTNERYQIAIGDIFDYGYALTVHKAQGSQAKRVVLFEETSSKMDFNYKKRWLYTAITRAEEELYIISNV